MYCPSFIPYLDGLFHAQAIKGWDLGVAPWLIGNPPSIHDIPMEFTPIEWHQGKDGFIGSVTASTAAPFYTTSCTAVECPAHSTGGSMGRWMSMLELFHDSMNSIAMHYWSWLVVTGIWLAYFPDIDILGIIIPIDWYFSDGLKPPTRYMLKCIFCMDVCSGNQSMNVNYSPEVQHSN